MLDDKIRKFAEIHGIDVYKKVEKDGVTYCFITEFSETSEFCKDKMFKFWHKLGNDGVDINGVLLTVLPIKNPEKYSFLGERVY